MIPFCAINTLARAFFVQPILCRVLKSAAKKAQNRSSRSTATSRRFFCAYQPTCTPAAGVGRSVRGITKVRAIRSIWKTYGKTALLQLSSPSSSSCCRSLLRPMRESRQKTITKPSSLCHPRLISSPPSSAQPLPVLTNQKEKIGGLVLYVLSQSLFLFKIPCAHSSLSNSFATSSLC